MRKAIIVIPPSEPTTAPIIVPTGGFELEELGDGELAVVIWVVEAVLEFDAMEEEEEPLEEGDWV